MENKEKVNILKELNEFNEYIKKQDNADFMQDIRWGKVKKGWEQKSITLRDDKDNLVFAMNILFKKIPLLGNIMYAPRGFVGTLNDDNIEQLEDFLKMLAKEYNAFLFISDPYILQDDTQTLELLNKYNFKIAKNKGLQPNRVMVLDLSGFTTDNIIMHFKQKTRYNIRQAIKKGITVKSGNSKELLNQFYEILKQTGSRQEFAVRDISYFEDILENFKEEAKIFVAYKDDTPIAATLEIIYGNKTWYFYGGFLKEYSSYYGPQLLQLEMMKDGINNNCKYYDFGGIAGCEDPNSRYYGVYNFKKGFNGQDLYLTNEVQYIFNPIKTYIYRILDKIRSKF